MKTDVARISLSIVASGRARSSGRWRSARWGSARWRSARWRSARWSRTWLVSTRTITTVTVAWGGTLIVASGSAWTRRTVCGIRIRLTTIACSAWRSCWTRTTMWRLRIRLTTITYVTRRLGRSTRVAILLSTSVGTAGTSGARAGDTVVVSSTTGTTQHFEDSNGGRDFDVP